MIRILLVDDQNLIQEGIKALLDQHQDLKVIGTVRDGRSAIKLVDILHPDIVLVDIEMPGMDGITVTKYISCLVPKTKVIILTSHEDKKYVTQALLAGAKGYILKSSLMIDLKHAILAVDSGYSQLESRLLAKVFNPDSFKLKKSKSSNPATVNGKSNDSEHQEQLVEKKQDKPTTNGALSNNKIQTNFKTREFNNSTISHSTHSVSLKSDIQQEKAENLESELFELTQQTDNLKSELSELTQQTSNLESELSELTQQTNPLESELSESTTEEEIGNLELELSESTQSAEIDNLESELSELTQQTNPLESELSESTQSEEIENLESELSESTQSAEIDNLESELSELTQQTNPLESELSESTIQEEIENRESELSESTQSEEIENLESELSESTQSAEIDNLESELSELTQQTNQLESELSAQVRKTHLQNSQLSDVEQQLHPLINKSKSALVPIHHQKNGIGSHNPRKLVKVLLTIRKYLQKQKIVHKKNISHYRNYIFEYKLKFHLYTVNKIEQLRLKTPQNQIINNQYKIQLNKYKLKFILLIKRWHKQGLFYNIGLMILGAFIFFIIHSLLQ